MEEPPGLDPHSDTSDVVLGRGTLVAVHAHPDDETLFTGGLLAAWAAAGGRTVVVTCTRGERGETIGDDLAALEGDGEALAALRIGEIAAAARDLGVSQHWFLDELDGADVSHRRWPRWLGRLRNAWGGGGHSVRYEDSGMAWVAGPGSTAGLGADVPERAFVRADLDAAAVGLVALLRRERPAVVVTYEPTGGYGHPDHVLAHDLTMKAVEILGPFDALMRAVTEPVPLWDAMRRRRQVLGVPAGQSHHPAVPTVLWRVTPPAIENGARDALRAWLAGGGAVHQDHSGHRAQLRSPDAAAQLPGIADGRWSPAWHLPIEPVAPRVLAALRAYRSQVQAVTAISPSLPIPAESPGPAAEPPSHGADSVSDWAGRWDDDGADASEAPDFSHHGEPIDVIGCYALSNGILTPLTSHEWYAEPPALSQPPGLASGPWDSQVGQTPVRRNRRSVIAGWVHRRT